MIRYLALLAMLTPIAVPPTASAHTPHRVHARTAAPAAVLAPRPAATTARGLVASAWDIGPTIEGRNYSRNTPPSPSAVRGGMAVDIPGAPGSVHYVTRASAPLAGARRIVMRYRIDLAPGARIYARTAPDHPGMLTLYFQRAGDTWSGNGRYEAYRWYATFATDHELAAGEHTMVAPLDALWTAVERSSAANNPRGFAGALAETDRIGFVLGGGDGYGHGVYASGPARIVVTDFHVE